MADDRNREIHGAMIKRFSLWLAVGNGGGLVLAGSQFAGAVKTPLAYALFPSLWAFALGLVCAGIFSLGLLNMFSRNDPNGEDASDGCFFGIGLLGATACFLVGLFYPLVLFSVRYFAQGSFA